MVKKIIVAEPHGYCGNEKYGVHCAVDIAEKTAKKYPKKTYLLGEIVHNQHVVDWLEKEHGAITVHDIDQIPQGAIVVIRAHGTSPETLERAKKRGLKTIDATCLLVTQIHKEVKDLANQGKKILYIASNINHEEAMGVAGEAPELVILTTLEEIDKIKIDEPENTVVLTQTTLSILETEKAINKLKKKYPSLKIKPHICLATTQRQKAVIELAKKTHFVIIVGSPTSSNSNRLKEVAEAVGAKAYMVDNASELKPTWFKNIEKVAISSGASTPEWLLEEVIERIKTF